LNPKIVEVYTKVGQLLSRYKSGPLPKAFKILPSLRNWFQILEITSPHSWTPHATLAATRIFASNLEPRQCQKFYKNILYEKVREEIDENKKLSVQMYMALKKSIYKPAAFFKGILFPLCEVSFLASATASAVGPIRNLPEAMKYGAMLTAIFSITFGGQSGTCTLKEAVIVGSILTKVSIPVLHSGAALLKLSGMDYTGPTSVFIRVLLDKKYALPYKVIDGLVFHFLSFKRESRQMPVLWHQSFLVFVQRYKSDLTREQKDALLDLLKVKSHPLITQEIRREIFNSVARGEEMPIEDVEMV
jgi:essential nuclear protein 1